MVEFQGCRSNFSLLFCELTLQWLKSLEYFRCMPKFGHISNMCMCSVVYTIRYDTKYANRREAFNVTDNSSRSCFSLSLSLSPKCICVLRRAFPKSKHIHPQKDHFQSLHILSYRNNIIGYHIIVYHAISIIPSHVMSCDLLWYQIIFILSYYNLILISYQIIWFDIVCHDIWISSLST